MSEILNCFIDFDLNFKYPERHSSNLYLPTKEGFVGFFSDIFSDGDRTSPQNISKRIRELERQLRRGDFSAGVKLSMYKQTGEVNQLYVEYGQ